MFDIDLPVDVFDALPNFFFADLHEGLIIFDFVEILNDGLKVECLGFVEYHLILRKVGELCFC